MKHEINLNGKFNTNMIDEINNKKIKRHEFIKHSYSSNKHNNQFS